MTSEMFRGQVLSDRLYV